MRAVVPALILLAVVAAPDVALSQHAPNVTSVSQHDHTTTDDASALFPPREVSGTAWLPDETPMFGIHRTWRGWEVMLHGSLFAQFLYEPGDRHRTGGLSERQLSSANWGMVMARRPLRAGRVGVRAMISAEPWTVAGCGFLNYLATGEMCRGDTIHDRQHPHDLFMELAADYDRPVRGTMHWQIYGGLSGEPALGPTGFPHRLSAMPNPVAPISHHWLDSSHITYGLITTGLYDHHWKAEMSFFNGREPDQHRADLDLGPLDSVSGRLSFMPTRRLALQISAGHLHEAAAEFAPRPRSDVNRATASATYHRALADNGVWATTIAYGLNSSREFTPVGAFNATTHAGLFESTLMIREQHTWFARAEVVGKPAHDLHADEFGTSILTVGKFQGGYVRHLQSLNGMVPGIGVTASASLLPAVLAPRYSGRVAPGFGVFLMVRPSSHVKRGPGLSTIP